MSIYAYTYIPIYICVVLLASDASIRSSALLFSKIRNAEMIMIRMIIIMVIRIIIMIIRFRSKENKSFAPVAHRLSGSGDVGVYIYIYIYI